MHLYLLDHLTVHKIKNKKTEKLVFFISIDKISCYKHSTKTGAIHVKRKCELQTFVIEEKRKILMHTTPCLGTPSPRQNLGKMRAPPTEYLLKEPPITKFRKNWMHQDEHNCQVIHLQSKM